jgi:hypothetical protein
MCNGTRLHQRSLPRVDASHHVMFTTPEQIRWGRLVNVGLPGCAIESPRLLRIGQLVKLSVLLPDDQEPLVITLAKVKWWADGYAGLEFLFVFPQEESRLRDLVGC